MYQSRIVSFCALALLVAGVLATPAGAQILQSTNFEPPTFTTGDLEGQDGWTGLGTAASDPGTALIQTAIAKGTQALKIDTSPLFDDPTFFYKPGLNYDATGKKITVSYDINIQPRSNPANPTDRSSFIVGLFNSGGAAETFVGIANDGSIYYNDAAGGAFYTLPNPITENSGWNTISYTADFNTGAVAISLNGTLLPISDAVLDPTAGSVIADLDIAARPSGYDQAVFDNIVVSAPEPGSLALLVPAVAGLMAKRRRR